MELPVQAELTFGGFDTSSLQSLQRLRVREHLDNSAFIRLFSRVLPLNLTKFSSKSKQTNTWERVKWCYNKGGDIEGEYMPANVMQHDPIFVVPARIVT